MEPDDPITQDIHDRVKADVKAVLEQVLEEEMSEHLQAEYRERTERRRRVSMRETHSERDIQTIRRRARIRIRLRGLSALAVLDRSVYFSLGDIREVSS